MTQKELREKTKGLFAPRDYGDQPCCYHEASDEMIAEHAGGCGPGGRGDALVPDTIWFLNVKPSCSIHDWMYGFGRTEADREMADRVFLNNMLRQIERETWPLKQLRRIRALTYYSAVRDFGGPAFWKGKNHDIEEGSLDTEDGRGEGGWAL